jgi:tetratricopeptide (TPR) repeat protein
LRPSISWFAWLAIAAAAAVGCAPIQRIDPEASLKRYQVAEGDFTQGNFRAALDGLLKAIALNPQNSDAHYLLGLLSLRQASETERMIETETCVAGGEAKLERQEIDEDFHKAEAAFRRAVEIKSDFSEAWNSLAVVQLHFQRWDDAVAATEKALANALYRQPWAALGNLGWAYFQKREYLRAAKELRTAVFSNPQFCVGRYRLAKVYYDQKSWDTAAEELEKVTSDKACPIQEAFLLAGLVALKRGERPRAAELFRRCSDLSPKSCLAQQCRIAE